MLEAWRCTESALAWLEERRSARPQSHPSASLQRVTRCCRPEARAFGPDGRSREGARAMWRLACGGASLGAQVRLTAPNPLVNPLAPAPPNGFPNELVRFFSATAFNSSSKTLFET